MQLILCELGKLLGPLVRVCDKLRANRSGILISGCWAKKDANDALSVATILDLLAATFHN